MSSQNDTAEMVATNARDTGNYLARYAMDHPISMAVTVGALAWWMLRDRNRAGYYGINDTSWENDDGVVDATAARRSLRDRVGDYASTARDTVGEYAASARGTVGDYAVSARSSAARASERVRGAANTAYSSTGGWISENPIAAGAIALAVGAAIGMSFPRTEAEDHAMGQTRDATWRRASRAARNLKENVSQRVATAAENFATESLFGPPAPRTGPAGRL